SSKEEGSWSGASFASPGLPHQHASVKEDRLGAARKVHRVRPAADSSHLHRLRPVDALPRLVVAGHPGVDGNARDAGIEGQPGLAGVRENAALDLDDAPRVE